MCKGPPAYMVDMAGLPESCSALLGNYCTRTVMYAYSGMPENKEDRYNKTRGRLKAGLHLAKIQW